MADGPLKHPDPRWWERYEPIEAFASPRDLCNYCGHVRYLHVNGCNAKSASLIGNPDPCDCTNTAVGKLYRDASRIRPAEHI